MTALPATATTSTTARRSACSSCGRRSHAQAATASGEDHDDRRAPEHGDPAGERDPVGRPGGGEVAGAAAGRAAPRPDPRGRPRARPRSRCRPPPTPRRRRPGPATARARDRPGAAARAGRPGARRRAARTASATPPATSTHGEDDEPAAAEHVLDRAVARTGDVACDDDGRDPDQGAADVPQQEAPVRHPPRAGQARHQRAQHPDPAAEQHRRTTAPLEQRLGPRPARGPDQPPDAAASQRRPEVPADRVAHAVADHRRGQRHDEQHRQAHPTGARQDTPEQECRLAGQHQPDQRRRLAAHEQRHERVGRHARQVQDGVDGALTPPVTTGLRSTPSTGRTATRRARSARTASGARPPRRSSAGRPRWSRSCPAPGRLGPVLREQVAERGAERAGQHVRRPEREDRRQQPAPVGGVDDGDGRGEQHRRQA